MNEQNFQALTQEQKNEIISLLCNNLFSLETIFKAGYRVENTEVIDMFAELGSLSNFESLHHYQPDFSFKDINIIKLEKNNTIDDFHNEKDERQQTKIFINTVIRHQNLNTSLDEKSKYIAKKI